MDVNGQHQLTSMDVNGRQCQKEKDAKDIHKKLGQSIYLLGVYITRKETQTNRNESMQFLTLEDETDMYECILFPKVFSEFGDIVHWETLFIIYVQTIDQLNMKNL